MTNPATRWTYFEQQSVDNIRIEAIRNLEEVPTLAGLTEKSAPRLLEIQKNITDGLQGLKETSGTYVTFEDIADMEDDEKD